MSSQNRYEIKVQISPIYLEKIGKFIQDCYLFHTGKLRPCIVIGPANDQDFCLVVAKMGGLKHNKNNYNFFGGVLNRTAEKAEIKHRNSSFDPSVLEVYS